MIATLLIICLCLLLNAVFASIEMAFVTIRRPELRQKAKQGNRNAIRLLQLRETPERALSVIQIGITLVGAISAAVGGAGAEEALSPYFEERFGMREPLAEAISIALIVAPLTYLSVVLGELVPKTIALRYPQAVLRFGTTVLVVGSKLLGPIVTLFEVSTRFILKIVLRNAAPSTVKDDEDGSEVNLEDMEIHHRQYILNLANIEGKRINDIYLPWNKVVCVNCSDSFGVILQEVIRSGHTRLPVLDSAGKVVGVLHSKEFLSFVDSGNTDWQSIIRSPQHVRLEDDLLTVLRSLQSQKHHMAVITRGGLPIGLVTVEDILEEIVGDIFDEDDDGLVQKLLSQRGVNRSGKAKTLLPYKRSIGLRSAAAAAGTAATAATAAIAPLQSARPPEAEPAAIAAVQPADGQHTAQS